MRFVIGADEACLVLEHIAKHLRDRGHEATVLPVKAWAEIAIDIGREVAGGHADHGVVCCFTGTGVSMAANKISGVRAALCVDAQTAAGARKWNDANVLALSLRLLSLPLASEIVDAWLDAAYAGSEGDSLERLAREERR